jgi:5-hydroxyisourate hydrolase-like protein (transthyretin family)
MKRVIGLLALGALCGLGFLFPGSLQADEGPITGAIKGTLVSGTSGAPVPNLEVVLQRYEGEQERDKQRTLSDAEGKFSFPKLETGKGTSYGLQVTYEGVEYYGPSIVVDEKKREVTVPLMVYETTGSNQDVSVITHHVLAEPEEGALWVKEVMVLQNTGNRVYVGTNEIAPEKKETLRISLPADAKELQLLEGLMSCCIVEAKNGFSDTMDIKPGKKEIMFSYKIDYGFSALELKKQINMKTDALDFYIPDRGIQARGENIQYAGTIGQGESKFLRLAGRTLGTGTKVAIQLEGLPLGRKILKGLGTAAGAALVGFGFVYPFVRRKRSRGKRKQDRGEEPQTKGSEEEESQRLVRAMAALDDRLDSGQISPEEHARTRRMLKEKIVQIRENWKNAELEES